MIIRETSPSRLRRISHESEVFIFGVSLMEVLISVLQRLLTIDRHGHYYYIIVYSYYFLTFFFVNSIFFCYFPFKGSWGTDFLLFISYFLALTRTHLPEPWLLSRGRGNREPPPS